MLGLHQKVPIKLVELKIKNMIYKLITKSGETVSKCEAYTLEDAEDYFTLRKDLELVILLQLFDVVVDDD